MIYRIETMTPQDVTAVMDIEIEAFSAPWSARAYDYELRYNEMAHYYSARPTQELVTPIVERQSLLKRLLGREKAISMLEASPTVPLVGYGGFWLMVDEAHISTIATHADWRRRGIGELLLLAMIDGATEVGARWVTLEVRVSNTGAQRLYHKYGFDVTGIRKRYYSDNNEDALIMTTPLITTIDYQIKLQGLKGVLFKRLEK
ncbi:MAG: ribosomal protein S18-alanine N-acetyltransferase [Chloroflexi bacterium]|nr:ribosomal protein S18-alanine N-acetyltransferase [Chloroflexota bacterium]